MVNVECPPFFIWQCSGEDDPRGALNLADRLTVFGIPFELHIFPEGVHGTAMSDGSSPNEDSADPHVAHWVELCSEWLESLGF
jgi:acetyl esterase/lipase